MMLCLEAASFRPVAEVSCMGANSWGRLWGREEPSMKEDTKFSGSQREFNMPGRGACFIGKCGEFVGNFLVSQS